MLGVVKSIKISRLIALQNKTPVEGKIAWGNHQKDIETSGSQRILNPQNLGNDAMSKTLQ